jgi:GNAT superfamily N-acetyltransferase
MLDVYIRELSPEVLEDYLAFFEQDVFEDDPVQAGCYCRYYQFSGERWDIEDAEDNREAVCARILRGEAEGLLAYVDGHPAAFCQAAPPAKLPSLERWLGYAVPDADQVGVVSCFVVGARYRRLGLARLLLDAACDRFSARGLAFAEGYPFKTRLGDQHPGALRMFLDAGFVKAAELERRWVVRKSLGRALRRRAG